METQLTKPINKYIDHTLLKAYASNQDFIKVCDECKKYDFMMIAINSSPVVFCKEQLKATDVHVGAAIGFPLGQTTIKTKVAETEDAIANGADEIDYVINIGQLKNKNYEYLEEEMRSIVSICRAHNVMSKVIFEICYLEKEEIVIMSEIAKRVKPDFIKTSTGFGTSGATIEAVKLMKQSVGKDVKVKAAGGIRDLATFMAMIEAGAERIGTSNGVQIVEEYRALHSHD